jgi:hypothetical protein
VQIRFGGEADGTRDDHRDEGREHWTSGDTQSGAPSSAIHGRSISIHAFVRSSYFAAMSRRFFGVIALGIV